MKNSIHYSPEAQNDMDEIWEYIVFVFREIVEYLMLYTNLSTCLFLYSSCYPIFKSYACVK